MSHSRVDVLSKELQRRLQEIAEYDLQIDLFKRALAVMDSRYPTSEQPDLQPFRAHLENLILTNRTEREKAHIMLQAVQQVLGDEPRESAH